MKQISTFSKAVKYKKRCPLRFQDGAGLGGILLIPTHGGQRQEDVC